MEATEKCFYQTQKERDKQIQQVEKDRGNRETIKKIVRDIREECNRETVIRKRCTETIKKNLITKEKCIETIKKNERER